MKRELICVTVALLLFTLMLIPHSNVLAQNQTQNLAQNIKVLNYSYYIDPSGSLLDVVGECQNIGNATLDNVTLGAEVFGSDGSDQGASSGPAYTVYLNPNETVPFDISFSRPYNSPDNTWFSVSIANITMFVLGADATTSYQYPDLKVVSSSGFVSNGVNDSGTYWITGTVQNTGNQNAEQVQVVAAFYNSSGTTVAVGFSSTLSPASLSPSATAPFQVGAFDLNMTMATAAQKITSYSLKVHCVSPVLEGSPPTSDETSSSVGTTTSQPSTQNSSQSTATSVNATNATIIRVVVIAIIVVAVIGTIVSLRKRKAQNPKTRKAALKSKKQNTKQ